eukprot:m.97166 g.97166  ORF g.97166 m.97166 type:complete len:227 (-) comp16691_c0_seq1:366-1046(-)
MSWLAKALGGGGGGGAKKAAPQPSENESLQALEKINGRIELLDKKLDYLEKQSREQQALAKKTGTKTPLLKKKAMMYMKRYKSLQEQARHVEGQRDNLDAQRSALEMAQLNRGTVEVMGDVQKVINKSMDIDKTEDILDDVLEGMDKVNEVTELMSRPMGPQQDADELEDELAEFLAEDMADDITDEFAALPEPGTTELGEELPEPATTKLTQEQMDEDDLVAWAS